MNQGHGWEAAVLPTDARTGLLALLALLARDLPA